METFRVMPGYKPFMAFGILFFAACCAASVVLALFPPANTHAPAMQRLMPVCAIIHAAFAVLCFSVWRMLDDTVEVSESGIASRRRHKPDIQLAWNEIAAVDASVPGCCLKLRAADGRMIRLEYQFENFSSLLNRLERTIALPEDAGGSVSFGSITVEPGRVICKKLFRRRTIAMKDIRNIRLELINRALVLLIQERSSAPPLKLTHTKKLFHLAQLLRHHHECMNDSEAQADRPARRTFI